MWAPEPHGSRLKAARQDKSQTFAAKGTVFLISPPWRELPYARCCSCKQRRVLRWPSFHGLRRKESPGNSKLAALETSFSTVGTS